MAVPRTNLKFHYFSSCFSFPSVFDKSRDVPQSSNNAEEENVDKPTAVGDTDELGLDFDNPTSLNAEEAPAPVASSGDGVQAPIHVPPPLTREPAKVANGIFIF